MYKNIYICIGKIKPVTTTTIQLLQFFYNIYSTKVYCTSLNRVSSGCNAFYSTAIMPMQYCAVMKTTSLHCNVLYCMVVFKAALLGTMCCT